MAILQEVHTPGLLLQVFLQQHNLAARVRVPHIPIQILVIKLKHIIGQITVRAQ